MIKKSTSIAFLAFFFTLLTACSRFSSPTTNSSYLLVSGDEIQIEWQNGPVSCSISYLSKNQAVTAGHCGTIGATVYSHGVQIGNITENFLFNGKNLDLAVITLKLPPDFSVNEEIINRIPINTMEFFTVRNYLKDEILGKLTETSFSCQAFTLDGTAFKVAAFTIDASTDPGDSGAPVYSKTGELVAIVQGGNGRDKTTITPINILLAERDEGSDIPMDLNCG